MRKTKWLAATALIYAALTAGANAAGPDLESLRVGEMRKLAVHATPKDISDAAFTTEDGTTLSLAEFEGKTVLLNFWATWCAPCRKEMPFLDNVQAELGGDDFAVVAVATGKNDINAIKRFFDDFGVKNLTIYLDPKSGLARDMGVFGLPITLILDPNGKEIARMRGEADWSTDDAVTLLKAVIGGEAS